MTRLRQPRVRVFVALTAAIAVISFAILVAVRTAPQDPWVQYDRTVADPSTMSPRPVPADDPLELTFDVPTSGLDRVDLRFHREAPEIPSPPVTEESFGTLRVGLRKTDAARDYWSVDVDVSALPQDDWASLLLPHVSHADDPQIILTLLHDHPSELGVWTSVAEGITMAHWTDGRSGDPDLATFQRVESRVDRARVVADRVNRTHPQHFRFGSIVFWFVVGVVAALALVVVIVLQALHRPDLRTHEHDGIEVPVDPAATPPAER